MSWNYRLIRRQESRGAVDDVDFAVHEVHYDDAGRVIGWSQEPATLSGDNFNEAMRAYILMGDAFKNPALEQQGDTLVMTLEER